MGILSEDLSQSKNILTEHGFKYTRSSVTGQLLNCFEKRIRFSNLYYGWVAVKTSGEVYIYVEYECGGEVATYSEQLENKWEDSHEEFFAELDELVTGISHSWE